jgi:hypothetical protein
MIAQELAGSCAFLYRNFSSYSFHLKPALPLAPHLSVMHLIIMGYAHSNIAISNIAV